MSRPRGVLLVAAGLAILALGIRLFVAALEDRGTASVVHGSDRTSFAEPGAEGPRAAARSRPTAPEDATLRSPGPSGAPSAEPEGRTHALSSGPAERLPGSAWTSGDGPELAGTWPDGTPEYAGAQVRGEAGEWVRHGPWTAWYENGQVFEEGAYALGREEGPWRWFWPDGTPQAVGSFADGEREGPWTFWHESGERLLEGRYAAGAATGLWTSWHEDGGLWSRGVFSDGRMVGRWSVFHASGRPDLERSGLYEDGEKIAE